MFVGIGSTAYAWAPVLFHILSPATEFKRGSYGHGFGGPYAVESVAHVAYGHLGHGAEGFSTGIVEFLAKFDNRFTRHSAAKQNGDEFGVG